jgi:glycine/D-amino acid oxidase-like deaminating enzyme
MMGDSQEDVGFDIRTTTPILRTIAQRNLAATLPALKDANIVRTWAALRVMTPDGCPISQQSTTHPGAFAATCHSGVTLAGAHALALAPPSSPANSPSLDAFNAERFDVPAA